MRIEVTADHISKGFRMARKSCPIALAMKDAGLVNPTVGVSGIWHGPDGDRRYCAAKKQVARFITDFDECLKVEPFNFLLEG